MSESMLGVISTYTVVPQMDTVSFRFYVHKYHYQCTSDDRHHPESGSSSYQSLTVTLNHRARIFLMTLQSVQADEEV